MRKGPFFLKILTHLNLFFHMLNNIYFSSKTLLEIIVQTSTMLFIISNMDKGATNNLMIVMRKLAIIMVATH